MAIVAEEDKKTSPNNLLNLVRTPNGRNIALMVGVAAVAAAMAGVWMWGQQPEYRVLFSNYSDRDGGAIVASLQQMNVPYKFAEGGGAILVPADRVHDARLKLASQGLPKGGNVGFELMENQRLGVSQFLEQVNFQRALEGELARSIQSVAAVQAARVHLALPKNSVFVRDQQKPTASVLLNLHPGRALDRQQVSAIVHLVASSVPELSTKNVTVVDQEGNLLSETGKQPGANGLDPTQLKYVQELQQSIVHRIESIITPIVGANNVRAEATADVDFSTSEQAAEMYKPNQGDNPAAVRSQHSSEMRNGGNTASGVPGALTNQPPAPATAPLTTPPGAPATANAAASANGANGATASGPTQRDSTVNYEVDKTVRYVQQPMGGIKRLSVAVVVNYKRVVEKGGKVAYKPLSDAEKAQIADLVKEAMGYNKERGDSLNVVNSPFAGLDKEAQAEPPIWKQPEMLDLAKEAGKYLLIALVTLFMYFKLLRPLLDRLTAKEEEKTEALPAPVLDEEGNPIPQPAASAIDDLSDLNDDEATPAISNYQRRLEAAKRLAKENPKVVANVVKEWVTE
ncbi:flagellar basal-body MS-ring/collar protein FliF [Noviherbaspirillum sp. UKPF54]|uniref:flagellar basal-body MS-ring/collar protein FliF n=1 Tax=Noviherbaspirillum sp. UKPF54 TaxID=2601898 RepID=UPI0011B1A927|nr:flagellar basal-body MS-ring/collar protein FliF [Noviherbaspirillum sp. UKPF54]QDZ28108.1 flagellar basal body M-ring protein FliF [Noviherbaspirillum sp. UKPF54]